jgi:hypothetical protein
VIAVNIAKLPELVRKEARGQTTSEYSSYSEVGGPFAPVIITDGFLRLIERHRPVVIGIQACEQIGIGCRQCR